jgi:hypothetical protein
MPRGTNQITDLEFVNAYNNPALNNTQVVQLLDSDGWIPIGVKLRGERVLAHLVVSRSGAMARQAHSLLPLAALQPAARRWLVTGEVATAEQWKDPAYVGAIGDVSEAAVEAAYQRLLEVERDAPVPEPAPAPAPAADETAGDEELTEEGTEGDPESAEEDDSEEAADSEEGSDSEEGNAGAEGCESDQAEGEVSFIAEIFGQNYKFSGATLEEARHAMFDHLVDMNFSKVAVQTSSGATIGFSDIAPGGRYKITKQLTAA